MAQQEKIIRKGTATGGEFTVDNHAAFIVSLARALAYNTHEIMLCIVENKGAISNFDDDAMGRGSLCCRF